MHTHPVSRILIGFIASPGRAQRMKVQQGHNRTAHPRASLLIIAFPTILHLNPRTDGNRRRRTDSTHDRFTRAAIISTKAEETKRLCRNRVLKMALRNLVHYFRARIHTCARSPPVYLREIVR